MKRHRGSVRGCTGVRRCVRSACVGALATAGMRMLTSHYAPRSWERRSFNGSTVQLTGGLDAATGVAVAGATAFAARHADTRAGQLRAAAGIVSTCAGAVAGGIDDHLEKKFPAQGKGFHGHLGALRHGKVTSGLLKIAGVGLGSINSASLIDQADHMRVSRKKPNTQRHQVQHSSVPARLCDITINTLLIASTANFINLLDLRPGRAVKAVGASSALASAFTRDPEGAAALVGTAVAAAPSDLSGETMLGDLGANALGAQLGVVLAQIPARSARCGVLGLIIGLTALSEKVSFSQVIENNSILRALDRLGRTHADSSAQTDSPGLATFPACPDPQGARL